MLTDLEKALTTELRKLAIVPATLRNHRRQADPTPDGNRCLLCRHTWLRHQPEKHAAECLLEISHG